MFPPSKAPFSLSLFPRDFQQEVVRPHRFTANAQRDISGRASSVPKESKSHDFWQREGSLLLAPNGRQRRRERGTMFTTRVMVGAGRERDGERKQKKHTDNKIENISNTLEGGSGVCVLVDQSMKGGREKQIPTFCRQSSPNGGGGGLFFSLSFSEEMILTNGAAWKDFVRSKERARERERERYLKIFSSLLSLLLLFTSTSLYNPPAAFLAATLIEWLWILFFLLLPPIVYDHKEIGEAPNGIK